MSANPKTFNEMREVLGRFLKESPDAGKLWDLLTCLRGPDSPSERPSMTGEQHQQAYAGRRARKAKTVEVIRHHAFNGVVGGSARSRGDINYVTLPPKDEWEHFDRHVAKAAAVLGLEVKIEEPSKGVKVTFTKKDVEPGLMYTKGGKPIKYAAYVTHQPALANESHKFKNLVAAMKEKLESEYKAAAANAPLPLLEDK